MQRELSESAEVAIAEYLDKIDEGEAIDREVFIASHPELADDLRSFFANDDRVAAIVDEIGDTGRGDGSSRGKTWDTVQVSGAVGETTDAKQPYDTVVSGLVCPGEFGRYRLEKQLGEGAMGAVFLAEDTQLGRKVALKVPKVDSERAADFLERFLREARSAATLSHPNVCSVYDAGEIDGTHFISMQFVEGRPLSDYIGGKLQPVRQALKIVRKLALALAEAHAHGVVHRDLKPENVMVSKKGEPVVMDFGLARHQASGDLRATASGGLMGTPAYMSPEQVEGHVELIGPLSDQFSLGVVLYELLTGNIPFDGSLASVLGQIVTADPEPPSSLRPEVPPAVEAVCLKMLAKPPEDRFESMAAVAAAVAECLANEDATIPPDATESRPPERTSARASRADVRKSRSRKNAAAGTADLEPEKQRVEELLKSWKYKEATAALKKLSTVAALAPWVKTKLAEAKKGPAEAKANADALARTARRLVGEYDFKGAVELLSGFPKKYRTPAFAEVDAQARALAEEVEQREFDLEQQLLGRDYQELGKPVDELLAVQPTNRLAKKLRAAMDGTVKAGSRLDVHGTTVELDDIPSAGGNGLFAGFLPIAIAVVLLAGGTTWGLMHLLWAAPSLAPKFVIDAALLSGGYEFLVDGAERQPEEMQEGLKGMAAGVHEIVVKKDGKVVAKVNVEIPDDESPTIHITLQDGKIVVSTELPSDDTPIAADPAEPEEAPVVGGGDVEFTQLAPTEASAVVDVKGTSASPMTIGKSGWVGVPAFLRGACVFDQRRNGETREAWTEMTAKVDGDLYLAASWRYEGNSGGGWQAERKTEKQLVADGWELVGNMFDGPKVSRYGVFKRRFAAGESYAVRTNKRGAPLVIVPSPDPGPAGAPIHPRVDPAAPVTVFGGKPQKLEEVPGVANVPAELQGATAYPRAQRDSTYFVVNRPVRVHLATAIDINPGTSSSGVKRRNESFWDETTFQENGWEEVGSITLNLYNKPQRLRLFAKDCAPGEAVRVVTAHKSTPFVIVAPQGQ